MSELSTQHMSCVSTRQMSWLSCFTSQQYPLPSFQSQHKGNHKGGAAGGRSPFVDAAEGRLLCVGCEDWACLSLETYDMCLVESHVICLVETQDVCCVESSDMCFVQSQYKGNHGGAADSVAAHRSPRIYESALFEISDVSSAKGVPEILKVHLSRFPTFCSAHKSPRIPESACLRLPTFCSAHKSPHEFGFMTFF